MRIAKKICILLVMIVIIFSNLQFSEAMTVNSNRINENNIKFILEDFINKNKNDDRLKKYGFELSKSFLNEHLIKHQEGFWSLGVWVIEITGSNEGEAKQFVWYGGTSVHVVVKFTMQKNIYEINDWYIIQKLHSRSDRP